MTAEGFWRFACGTYALPGVEAACLELQDAHGLDVNLVLLAAWLAGQGLVVEEDAALEVKAAARAWQDAVTVPLRTARRNLKGPLSTGSEAVADLRRRVADLELEAERLEGARLVEALAGRAACGSPEDVFDLNAKRLLGGDSLKLAALQRVRGTAREGAGTPNP